MWRGFDIMIHTFFSSLFVLRSTTGLWRRFLACMLLLRRAPFFLVSFSAYPPAPLTEVPRYSGTRVLFSFLFPSYIGSTVPSYLGVFTDTDVLDPLCQILRFPHPPVDMPSIPVGPKHGCSFLMAAQNQRLPEAFY